MLREFKEEVEIVPLLEQHVKSPLEEEEEAEESTQVDKRVFSDPTRDVPIQGRDREIGVPISASLGAMRPLVGKLEMLLQAPPLQGCSNSKRIERVKDRIRLLKDDVEKMSSYLDQLSEVEDPSLMAICWMNEARDLSYDLEDYIDSLIFVRHEDPSLVPDNIKTTKSRLKFRSCLKFFGQTKTLKTQVVIIAEALSEFRMYVQEAIERHQRYSLHCCSTLRRRFVALGPMLLPTQYGGIVIDGRMNGFINSLANDGDQQLKVLSLLGPACLGKTTLARVLYDRLGEKYHCRAFIRVSKKPDMKRIFSDMLSQLQHQHPRQHCKEIDLIDNIKKYLQGKRYLIIIDDLWVTSVWDIINHAFPKGSQGSRIVTTTQIEDVAFTCCCYQSEHVFEMKPLDDDHSRKLFFNRLFGSESDCPKELIEVSNKIVEICDGLPLATISIASLLASQPVMSIDLLTYIHESLSSCFLAISISERTREALNLSFNNLPHYLKTCLMYLTMCPEGYKFLKDDLVKQWVAEGFIHARKRQDMEEVAESYLHELIGRRFIQPIHINFNNEVLSCVVHEAVHDLIAHKSAEENFIVAIDYGCRKNVPLYHKARRLSLLFDDAKYAKTPANIIKSQVRSLTFFGLFESMPSTTEFKLLRVLNLQLSGYGGSKALGRDENPVDVSVISELPRLKYLKIASHLCIKLPDYMGGLHCLETLDIIDAVVFKFGIGVYLPYLLHLYLSLRDERNVQNWIDEMPDLDKLKHLQDLRLTFSSARSLSQEESMVILQDFISGHGELKTIVFACDSSQVIDGASDATISWDDMAPPPLLQRFEFSSHRGCIFSRIPPWVEKHNNLSILKIAVKELQMICVGILRGLPALTALSLYVETVPVDKIIFDVAGFSVLKYFRLRFMTGIPWLKFEEDAMPNLLKLKLVFSAIASPRMHQHGTEVITIEHMPSVREISIKFGGAVADRVREYALRTFVSNHFRNPTISIPSVDYCSDGDKSTKMKQQQDEFMEENQDEYYKQQSDELLQDEPDESYKQQPDKIVEEEPDEYDKRLEEPSDNRISRPLGSSSHMHVPGAADCLSGSQSIGLDKNWEVSSRYPPEWVGRHEFTLDQLISATNNFSEENLLGESIFGPIYKGIIDGKIMVAVTKVTYGRSLLDLEYLVTSHNPHMVSLLGYCNQDKHNILVHEYMPRGSLKKHLCDTSLFASVPWLTRLKIAVGAAKGLSFLQESGKRASYSPFNASSILLDSDYSAKLWCFGLAKQNDSTMSELDRKKSNVYNFGVVLLELLAGRPSLGEKRLGSEGNSVEWFEDPCWFSEDKLHHIMDPGLEGRYSVRAVLSTARTARWCLRCGGARVPEKLPNMRDVVGTLEPLLSDGRNEGLLASGEFPRVKRKAKKSELAKFLVSSNADVA